MATFKESDRLDDHTLNHRFTAGISVVDVSILANGRLELRYYLREQALSLAVHRYGNILKTHRET
ncbi:MAG TPA: hypothetical protein VKJ47_01965 [Candidatus Binatia bacterium]|nr:hypothetical protein [Candidatus Binatia bacterium]